MLSVYFPAEEGACDSEMGPEVASNRVCEGPVANASVVALGVEVAKPTRPHVSASESEVRRSRLSMAVLRELDENRRSLRAALASIPASAKRTQALPSGLGVSGQSVLPPP